METAYLAFGMTEEQREEGAGQKPPKPHLLLEEQGTNLQTSQPSPPFSSHQSFIPSVIPTKHFTPGAVPNAEAVIAPRGRNPGKGSEECTFLNCLIQINSLWYMRDEFSSLVFRIDAGILHMVSKEGICAF